MADRQKDALWLTNAARGLISEAQYAQSEASLALDRGIDLLETGDDHPDERETVEQMVDRLYQWRDRLADARRSFAKELTEAHATEPK